MKPIFFLALFLFATSNLAQAQDKTADKTFWTVSSALIGSSIYDIESTYFVLDKCEKKCREANPIARPFIERGRPWAYAFQGSINAGLLYYSYRLKEDGNKLWYIPPLIVTAGHVAGGTWNIQFSKRF